jgi:SAM-dependent methyltransferase
MTSPVSAESVARVLRAHLPVYRWRRPAYQTAMLADLQDLWRDGDRRVLDVGGGTGVIAQAISDLFAVDKVASVDVENRFLPSLTIETATFDGRHLPFADNSFDCVLFSNVLHHVPPENRAGLLEECRRVAPAGALLLKDHLAVGALDHLRLTALDVIGNVPFHGMVRASYLGPREWRALAAASGYSIASTSHGRYRSGPMAMLFPNRLEVTMRWEPATAAAEAGIGALEAS